MPYTLQDADIPDDWRCQDNVWDTAFAACSVPQALSDEAIDAILAKQVLQRPSHRHLTVCVPPCSDIAKLLRLCCCYVQRGGHEGTQAFQQGLTEPAVSCSKPSTRWRTRCSWRPCSPPTSSTRLHSEPPAA